MQNIKVPTRVIIESIIAAAKGQDFVDIHAVMSQLDIDSHKATELLDFLKKQKLIEIVGTGGEIRPTACAVEEFDS